MAEEVVDYILVAIKQSNVVSIHYEVINWFLTVSLVEAVRVDDVHLHALQPV